MKNVALLGFVVPALALAREPGALATESGSIASNQMQMMGLMAALALVPFAIVMLTSFSKIVVVLSMVRSALGTQQAPPTMVLTGLAAVLTAHVMAPTLERMWATGRQVEAEVGLGREALSRLGSVVEPLRQFLVKHGSPEERARFVDMARELRADDAEAVVSEDDLSIIVPAFVITELKEAFIIAFLLFLPFLVLDMLLANMLLALGMQTLSPSQVSLPFKVLLFVAVDGWALLSRGLILGYR
ncbi:MAG: EscR/YscR/HrcR family type III secretion system export apparatus protein [Myxococcaceae bacterium]|jgi:type III secretion protein R|nr:EscR/YscR/HrcR family type III secretion system export apparatus protein [Myxococcaceae bacterium]MCA3011620.1 EscR/YscR/HrcR family type III secretion system export apparatus protein [Myxococcaceae bacterium]